MYSDNLIARPFPTWHLKPEIGEPAYGYFARLVEDEGHRSVTIYANEIGLTGRNLDPVELLASLDTLGYADMYKERLRTFTPVPHGELVALGNETLRPMQVSYTSRRFCPKCLAEKSYHRVWWDIVAFKQCPEHGAKIASETEDGERLKWWFANMTVTPQGSDLVTHSIVHSPDTDTRLERAILRRLGIVSGPEPEMLMGRSLHEIIEVSTMLGKLFASDEGHMSAGFAPFTSTRAHFVETIRQWLLDNVPENMRKKGFNAAYGGATYLWNRTASSKLAQEMCAGMRDALAPIGRLGRINAKKVSTSNMELGLSEAKKRLGMDKDAVKELAEHIGLDVGRYNFYFTPEAIERMEEALDEMITLNETVAITGIATHEFTRLERAGLIRGLRGVGRGGAPSRRYRRSEVEALVANLIGDTPFAFDVDATPVEELKRSNRLKQSALLLMAAKGEKKAVCRDARYHGLASLCFKLDGTTRRKRGGAGSQPSMQGSRHLTAAEVSIITGLNKDTIAALVKMDAFALVRGDSGQALIDRKSFETFHAEYASGQVYRQALGCPNHMVAANLRHLGVSLATRAAVSRPRTPS